MLFEEIWDRRSKVCADSREIPTGGRPAAHIALFIVYALDSSVCARVRGAKHTMRGRKPQPAHLQLVRDNSRKQSVSALEGRAAREARVPAAPLSPPPELTGDARLEWDRLSALLHPAGLLSAVDRGPFAAICQAYSRWMQAESILVIIAKKDAIFNGLMIRTNNGNFVQNPLVGTANKAMNDYVRLSTEFGMTPASRARIAHLEPPEDDDPAKSSSIAERVQKSGGRPRSFLEGPHQIKRCVRLVLLLTRSRSGRRMGSFNWRARSQALGAMAAPSVTPADQGAWTASPRQVSAEVSSDARKAR